MSYLGKSGEIGRVGLSQGAESQKRLGILWKCEVVGGVFMATFTAPRDCGDAWWCVEW